MSERVLEGVRVVLAKPGLDGHDRGAKVVAMALRDAGAEVHYLGLRRTPAQIADAAAQFAADFVGVSVLSGAHVALVEQLLGSLDASGNRARLLVGGTVPEGDAELLRAMGVAEVFPTGTPITEIVSRIARIVPEAARQ